MAKNILAPARRAKRKFIEAGAHEQIVPVCGSAEAQFEKVMTLQFRRRHWTLVLASGQAVFTFVSLEDALEKVPEAIVIHTPGFTS